MTLSNSECYIPRLGKFMTLPPFPTMMGKNLPSLSKVLKLSPDHISPLKEQKMTCQHTKGKVGRNETLPKVLDEVGIVTNCTLDEKNELLHNIRKEEQQSNKLQYQHFNPPPHIPYIPKELR